jgi:hypothetical protein
MIWFYPTKQEQWYKIRLRLGCSVLLGLAGCLATNAGAAVHKASPSNYASQIARLKAGDTLTLAPGTYSRITIDGLHGTRDAWIRITGPESGAPAIIVASACCNTIEILNSSFLSIENLTIDSKGIEGSFGISAKDGLRNLTHDIRIENNKFIGQGGSQQTVAISTKTPTWGWIVRKNEITGAGTGIYFGNSDGTLPFVGGLIEDNLIENTIGYNMEIKWQRARPNVPGMPVTQSSTIIRHNLFLKDDTPSPDGDRPNVLVGGFPENGPGSTDLYEVYGNLFVNNPREALFQASGRVSVHDNIFVGGEYTAVALYAQDLPLKLAHVYNNTIYTQKQGILFGSPALQEDAVEGNLIFAPVPVSGPVKHAFENMTDTASHAGEYVASPSFDVKTLDFYPLAGKCAGMPLDLTPFRSETGFSLDFNGTAKDPANPFRGAYAGAGTNPKRNPPPAAQAPADPAGSGGPPVLEISEPAGKRGETGTFLIVFHSTQGIKISGMQWELSVGPEIRIDPADMIIGSAAVEAGKTLTCSRAQSKPGTPAVQSCLIAGGQKTISDGAIAIVRYRVGRGAHAAASVVRIGKAVGVAVDLKSADLGRLEHTLTIQ